MKRVSILLTVQKALWGEVTPNLRAVFIGWSDLTDDSSIKLYFVYDGEISDDDKDNGECVTAEVLAIFPDNDVAAEFLQIDYPNKIPALGNEGIYFRKEDY